MCILARAILIIQGRITVQNVNQTILEPLCLQRDALSHPPHCDFQTIPFSSLAEQSSDSENSDQTLAEEGTESCTKLAEQAHGSLNSCAKVCNYLAEHSENSRANLSPNSIGKRNIRQSERIKKQPMHLNDNALLCSANMYSCDTCDCSYSLRGI